MLPLQKFIVLLAVVLGCMPSNAARADSKFESNGVKINFSEQGRGVPVILIHGYLSSGWVNWELPGIAKHLARDYRVIWLDVPPHGNSDKPTTEEGYGLELVEHVVRLLDHLKIRQAHIVGYSMGGIIAAKLSSKHPDRVLSATLGGMGWLREGSVEQKFFAAAGQDGKPHGLCFRSLAKLALTDDEVKGMKVPVRILFGDDDFLRSSYTQPLKKVRPDWKVIEIKEANHITCILKPEFRNEIKTWLDEQPKPAPKEPETKK